MPRLIVKLGASLSGRESGVGVPATGGMPASKPDYGECSCDSTLQYALPEPLAPTACPARCPGNTEGSGDRCGGGPGTYTMNLYHVDCSAWGSTFVVALMLGIGVYVGVGIGMERRVSGSAGKPLLQQHPHYGRWVAAWAIVLDGVAFSRGASGGRRTRAGSRVDDRHKKLLDADVGADRRKSPKEKGKVQAAEGGDRESRHQKEKRAANERARPASDAAAAPDGGGGGGGADRAAARSTPSGGSGRWVHVKD